MSLAMHADIAVKLQSSFGRPEHAYDWSAVPVLWLVLCAEQPVALQALLACQPALPALHAPATSGQVGL